MDHVILVDENDHEVGSEEKLLAHENGLLHRAFSVFVFNAEGHLLIQRRAADKYHSAGLFTNTCCSHPRPGESTEDAAHRRLQEEMGFDCELRRSFPLVYKASFDNGLVENEYDHVYIGAYDGPVSPNPDEVSEFRWMEPDALRDWLQVHPEAFTIWFRLSFERALEAHNHKHA